MFACNFIKLQIIEVWIGWKQRCLFLAFRIDILKNVNWKLIPRISQFSDNDVKETLKLK